MRVLIAEDDRGLREILVQGLEEAGYFVNAEAAVINWAPTCRGASRRFEARDSAVPAD
jgi:DNA-binding response OmpR family regulator